MLKLSQNTYRSGENTRDNPHELEGEQVQSLVNCYPSHPEPKPREGTAEWNVNEWPNYPDYYIPYRDDINGDKIIAIIGRSIYWAEAGSTEPQLVAENIFPEEKLYFSWERFFDSIYLITDSLNGNYNFIIEWDSEAGNFNVRKTNIDYEYHNWLVVLFGTNLPEGLSAKNYYYAITYVNLGDTEGEQRAYTTPISESAADLTDLQYFGPLSADEFIGSLINLAFEPDDSQVTHIRIWRTVGYDTVELARNAAQAGQMQYIGDAPAGPTTTFQDRTSDAALAGEINTIASQVGIDKMPSGTDIKYHNGYMWVSPVDRTERGKWYYSNAIQDAVTPFKYLSYYNYTTQFIETSLDNSEANTALGVAGNDLYFFMEESVWFLRDGDITFGPRKISNTQGSNFRYSFTDIENKIFYISNDGPAYVVDQSINIINTFGSGEVWPLTNYGKGTFFDVGVSDETTDKRDVIGWYYNNTWYLSWMSNTIGFYMPKDNQSIGSFQIEFGDPRIRIGTVAVLDIETCIIGCKRDSAYGNFQNVTGFKKGIYRFGWSGVNTDNSYIYKLKSKSRAMYVARDRDYSGEGYSLKVYSEFTDLGEFRFKVHTDFCRKNFSFLYDERSKTDALQNQGIDAKTTGQLQSKTCWRNVLQQGLPEGLIGHFFEVEWEKNFHPPFDFKCVGFDLEIIPRPEQPMEFVSVDFGDDESQLDDKLYGRLKSYLDVPVGEGWWSIYDIDAGYGLFTVSGENYGS